MSWPWRRSKAAVEHEALFESVTIHFTLTTHANGPINLASASRRLLQRELAESAAWPSEHGIRLPPSLKPLGRSLAVGERLLRDIELFESAPSPRSAVRFLLRHPTAARWPLLRGKRASADDGQGVRKMTEAINFARDVLVDAQKVSAAERHIDARLFGGGSRDRDEFVRLLLRGSSHEVKVPRSEERFRVVLEPRLLLHKSGVAQLTIAIPTEVALRTSQVVRLARPDLAEIVTSEMPEPFLAGYSANRLLGDWLEPATGGIRVRRMEFPETISIHDILESHIASVGSAFGARLPNHWIVHPTVIASAGSCCKDADEWMQRHGVDLTQVATRHPEGKGIDQKTMLGTNFSIDRDSVLYVNLGSTTRIQLRGVAPKPIDQLNTVLLIEHALLQYARLDELERSIEAFDLHEASLHALYRESLSVFTEMRQREVRFGSARTISKHLLTELGGEEMRRTIEGAVALQTEAYATNNAAAQSRRALRLTWIATILTSLVAIPTLRDLINYAPSLPQGSGLATFLAPLQWAASTGAWGPWVVVGAVIAFGVLTWFASAVLSTRFKWPMNWRRRGWRPVIPLEVTDEPDDTPTRLGQSAE